VGQIRSCSSSGPLYTRAFMLISVCKVRNLPQQIFWHDAYTKVIAHPLSLPSTLYEVNDANRRPENVNIRELAYK
jgi:hypothetical protein